ncbi:hypothetical protein [Paractinoplanes ferrugineus]|uniref:hypothetical protein n=1 Tax=Paractinoplanes ferrugineus TaxID=113564 RepID=UPI0019420358|nr:hypothetical protein [Actinoplanes ferrugineus]
MSPHTRLIPRMLIPATLGLLLLTSCGKPPRELPSSPPLNASQSAVPLTLPPSLGLPPLGQTPLPGQTLLPGQPAPGQTGFPGQPFPGQTGLPGQPAFPGVPGRTYPTYRYPTVAPTKLGPETVSPTPRPTPAPRCTGSPTNVQILDLLKKQAGVPKATLKVVNGPYCATDWSFSAVEVSGSNPDQLEPLMVVTRGKDATLAIVAAGSEVCIAPVQTSAPPGIRVLACGF